MNMSAITSIGDLASSVFKKSIYSDLGGVFYDATCLARSLTDESRDWKKIVGSGAGLFAFAGSLLPGPRMRALSFMAGSVGAIANFADLTGNLFDENNENQTGKVLILLQLGLSVLYGINKNNLHSLEAVYRSRKIKNQTIRPSSVETPRFPKNHVTPSYQTKTVVDKLMRGERFERVFVTVHPVSKIENPISDFINANREFQNVPRVMLEYKPHAFKVSEGLRKEASVIHTSVGGSLRGIHGFELILNAPEIHLSGGYYDACLVRTMEDLVEQFYILGGRELKLVVHKKLVYRSYSGDTLATSVKSDSEILETMMQEFRLSPFKKGWKAGDSSNHFYREYDRRKVSVIFQ